jgi:hypothetical protein
MSEATPNRACTNCGRTEIRPTVRICPNCGAVLPGLAGARASRAGFAALAQQVPQPETPTATTEHPPAESNTGTSQPWAIHTYAAPERQNSSNIWQDDQEGPFLTRSLWGDRTLGFVGEVAAVAFGVGILIATGEAANRPNLPGWSPAATLIGGIAVFTLCLWQAKRLRDSYPQLARGWYAGRSVWENTILPFLIGGAVVGLVLLLLGPLGLLAVCVGGVLVVALGPVGWILLAMVVFIVGRGILYAIHKSRNR